MKYLIFALMCLCTVNLASAQNESDKIVGKWLPDTKEAHIEIYQEDGKYHGKIVWLENTTGKDGNPVSDKKNPDKDLRGRPIIGMNVLTDLEYKNGKWVNGTIYSAKKGREADCSIILKGQDQIDLSVSVASFSVTKSWTRIE